VRWARLRAATSRVITYVKTIAVPAGERIESRLISQAMAAASQFGRTTAWANAT
jgi:hypothetical protein